MWKITARDFTLEEVLIMAGMNLLASADTAAPTSIAATAHRTGHPAPPLCAAPKPGFSSILVRMNCARFLFSLGSISR